MLRQPAFFIHSSMLVETKSTLVTHSQHMSNFLRITSLHISITLSLSNVKTSSKKLKCVILYSLHKVSISSTTLSTLLNLHFRHNVAIEQYWQLYGHPLLVIMLLLANSLTFFPLNLTGEK